MNLLHGLEADMPEMHEIRYIFSQATVVEEMLIALHHMQVSVCTVGRSRNSVSTLRKKHYFFPARIKRA